MLCHIILNCSRLCASVGSQRRIFIFSFGGVDKYLGGGGGGGAAACFGRGVVATPGKVKEKV